MENERDDRPEFSITELFGHLARSMDVFGRPLLDSRSRATTRTYATRQAFDLVRVIRERRRLASPGSRPSSSDQELSAAFAEKWQENPELAGSIYDVLIDLPLECFPKPTTRAREDFVNNALGVVVKTGVITPLPLSKPTTGIPIGARREA